MASQGNSQNRVAVEQKISEMVQQSKILEDYMNDILLKESAVAKLVTEAHLALEAIHVLSTSDQESLVPIGIGIYINVTVPEVRNLFVNVGSGVTIQKSKENTRSYVEMKIKEFELALKQLNSQKEQVTVRMNQLQNEINNEVQKSSRRTTI